MFVDNIFTLLCTYEECSSSLKEASSILDMIQDRCSVRGGVWGSEQRFKLKLKLKLEFRLKEKWKITSSFNLKFVLKLKD